MGRLGSAYGAALRNSLYVVLTGLAACSSRAPAPTPRPATAIRAPAAPAVAAVGGEVFSFPEAIQSPRRVSQLPEGLAPFFEQCKLADAALSRVAERFARRQSEGSAPLDVSEISFALRAEGSPYVWPRAWTLEGGDLESPAAVDRMRAWLRGFDDGGERRCGVALVSGGERSVLAAVAVDALADLAPLPVRLRSGSWVDVNANVLVPASDVKVMVLGPSGAPLHRPHQLRWPQRARPFSRGSAWRVLGPAPRQRGWRSAARARGYGVCRSGSPALVLRGCGPRGAEWSPSGGRRSGYCTA